MLSFEYYVKNKDVRRKSIDKKLAKSLVDSSKDRLQFADSIANKKPRYALENAYESIIELTDALLSLKGYKSWSHEANIAFLKKFNEFSLTDIERLDKIRRKRHSSKYYGISFEVTEVKKDVEFLNRIDKKVRKLLEGN